MNNFKSILLIIFVFIVGFYFGGKINDPETEKPAQYDCISDYKSWKVVSKQPFIVEKDCKFDTLVLPDYYLIYEMGDTLGKPSKYDKDLSEAKQEIKERRETDSILAFVDKLQ